MTTLFKTMNSIGSSTVSIVSMTIVVGLLFTTLTSIHCAPASSSSVEEAKFTPLVNSRGFLRNPNSPVPFSGFMDPTNQYSSTFDEDFMPSSNENKMEYEPIMEKLLMKYFLSHHQPTGLQKKMGYYPNGMKKKMDLYSNDFADKRSSYSKYCAFNAVSCFG